MMGSGSQRRSGTCPRCGRTHNEPEKVLCAQCRDMVLSEARSAGGASGPVKVRIGPIISDALTSIQAGEDIDEALLRALKKHHPEQAMNLLSAVARILEIEAEQANESKEQAARRLALEEPGPEIAISTSGGRVSESGWPTTVSETVSQTHLIRVGDKEYHSLEEVPPHIRRLIQGAKSAARRGSDIVPGMPSRGVKVSRAGDGLKTGCSWVLAVPLIAALVRLLAR